LQDEPSGFPVLSDSSLLFQLSNLVGLCPHVWCKLYL
jgi:hypothetical protein